MPTKGELEAQVAALTLENKELKASARESNERAKQRSNVIMGLSSELAEKGLALAVVLLGLRTLRVVTRYIDVFVSNARLSRLLLLVLTAGS